VNAALPPDDVAGATQTVNVLNAQAAELRAELERLQGELVALNRTLGGVQAQDLREANEQLVAAALHADTIAEAAVGKLDELARSSQFDALTGTPNRTLMLDRINSAVSLALRNHTQCAVAFLDIDDFKEINDSFGHDMGDAVIKLVANRVHDLVRRTDTVSRHGGDEFLLLLAELQHESDVAVVAAKILAGLAEPAMLGGKELHLSVSMGIAICPDDGEDATTLINCADAAMYRSKRRGRGAFEIHSSSPVHEQPAARSDRATRATTDGELRLRDLRVANEKLVLSALAAQQLQQDMSEEHQRQVKFLAMVAHELRSPLAPLGAAADLLKQAVADESLLVRLRGVIKRQVAHMGRLVDDLVDGSRASTGTFRLERNCLEIAAIIAHAVDTCHPAMERRLQHFTLELPPETVKVIGDPVRLAQVFSNLLDNASKYTQSEGSISLRARVQERKLIVTVTDNGIGISATALPTVFELFVQEEHAIVTNRSGLGIGLAVVRDLVQAHGGLVVCRSEGRNCGTEFIVTLPIFQE
jgi:diguanylate cyclase (GGDEF)-like protein